MNGQLAFAEDAHSLAIKARECCANLQISIEARNGLEAFIKEIDAQIDGLRRKTEERRKRFEAIPVLQAALRFKDGSTRRVAVSKPTDAIDEPHIGEMFYNALTRQGVVASLEDYPILVVDRRKRVVARIPVSATENIML